VTNEPRSTLGQLLAAASEDVRTLGAQTVGLARFELRTAQRCHLVDVGAVVSMFIAIAGAGVLMSAIVLITVALGLPAWAAATLVGLTFFIGGTLAARYFIDKARNDVTLKETRTSARETVEWIRSQASI
jgi:hypothetical protein